MVPRGLVVAIAMTAAGCGPAVPEVVIDDVAPRHTAAEIEAIARRQIGLAVENFGEQAPIRIVRVVATTPGRISLFEPEAGVSQPAQPEIVWLVRAEGTFGTHRGPRPAPLTATSGFFVIDDADGGVIGNGFP